VAVIDAFGARWTFDVSGLDDELAQRLLHLWGRALVAPGGDVVPPAFVVRRTPEGAVEVAGGERADDDRDVPYVVSRGLTIASIHRRSGSCVMLHAAGLAGDDGGTVALVAGSGTGKTTAGRLLGRSLGYVSDGTVAVEHDLTVQPYPKPLSIVTDPTVPTGKHEESPDDLGLRPAAPALRLAAVAVLERRDDAAGPVLEPIGLVEAMNLVLPQSSATPRLDRPLDRLARVLAIGHGPYRLTYRNIEDCVGLVTELAHVGRGHAIGDVTWTWFDGHGHVGDTTPVPDDLGPSTVVCRTAFGDAVASDGIVLLLRNWVPITLPGLAASVWIAADRPVAVSDLVALAEDELGPHPDAEDIIVATVRLMIEEKVLHVV
jgi:hypothetical protein